MNRRVARPEDSLRDRVKSLLDSTDNPRTPRDVARMLGVGREACLGVACGLPVNKGTLAIIRRSLEDLGKACPAPEASLSP